VTNWFKPDVIRGDIENTLTTYFSPPAYAAATTYAIGARVRSASLVYAATAVTTGSAPPSANWVLEGPTYPIIYENVPAVFQLQGAIRVAISWFETQDEGMLCADGRLRSVSGVISTWFFTPRNKGTNAGVSAAARMRRLFAEWDRIGTCGSQCLISRISGPRAIEPDPKADHFIHLLTGKLTTMERVGELS
jgi:hypothetical protein